VIVEVEDRRARRARIAADLEEILRAGNDVDLQRSDV
jgi:hypothetical protein